MTINLNQSSSEMLLDLINQDNNTTFTLADISFGIPTEYAGIGGRNTLVTVSAKPGRPYLGSFTFHYKRLDFSILWPTGLQFTTNIAYGNTHAILNLINNEYSLGLKEEDIANTTFVSGVATLTALSTSLAWIGSVQIQLNIPTSDIPSIISAPDLNGFSYPV